MLLVFYEVFALIEKDLAEKQDAWCRATEDTCASTRILEYRIKWHTNSGTIVFSIISVTGEDENTNGNSETRAALVESYVV